MRSKLAPYEEALPEGKMEILLRKADTDRDGTLDWDEFKALVSSGTVTDLLFVIDSKKKKKKV